jgi:hypothetical protein
VKSQRPKVQPIRYPTLFEMEKLDKVADLTSQLKIERPYFLPGSHGKIVLGLVEQEILEF